MIRNSIFFIVLMVLNSSVCAQVFNYGINEIAFQNIAKYGITYSKCDRPKFDSTVIAALEELWTFSDFKVIERLDRPERNSTILFVTQKDKTREFLKDRKNQDVMVLLPAELFNLKKEDVDMSRCLGYMYFDGFFPLMEEEKEPLFIKMIIGSLNAGLKWIKEHSLINVGQELNKSISESIIKESGTPLGNTLIIHREQTRSFVDMKLIEKLEIRHRLVGQDEYYNLIRKRNKKHYALYFSKNKFTEISIINIATGEIVYTKHFYEDYPELQKKEMKEMAIYFG